MRRKIAAALCLAAFCLAISSLIGASAQPTAKPATPATLVAGSNNATRNHPFTPPSKISWNPSSIRRRTHFGEQWERLSITKVFMSWFLTKTQEEWLDVRRAAVRMIEGANLLMMPDREAAPAGTKSEVPGVELEPAQITALIKKKRKSFDAFAKELQVLGSDALRASEAKNPMLLMDTGARMENVCESCHQAFWYPGAARASTRK